MFQLLALWWVDGFIEMARAQGECGPGIQIIEVNGFITAQVSVGLSVLCTDPPMAEKAFQRSGPFSIEAHAGCDGGAASANVTVGASPNIVTISGSASASNSGGRTAGANWRVSPRIRAVGGAVRGTLVVRSFSNRQGTVTIDERSQPVALGDGEEMGFTVECGAAFGGAVPASGSAGPSTATLTVEPVDPVSTTFLWTNSVGGSYLTPANWDPICGPPRNDGARQDLAAFFLPSSTFVPVTGSGVTARLWSIQHGAMVEFQGSGELQAPSIVDLVPTLQVLNGGKLRLTTGASLSSDRTVIGVGSTTESVLELVGGELTNPGDIEIGKGRLELETGGRVGALRLIAGRDGEAFVRVGQGSRLHVLEGAVLGLNNLTSLEVTAGGKFEASQASLEPMIIGQGAGATVNLRGDSSLFTGERALFVGGGADGQLNVERGTVEFNSVQVPGPGATSGSAQVQISGNGRLIARDRLAIGGTPVLEVDARAGGHIRAKELTIGTSAGQPGATADLTVRPGNPQGFELLVADETDCCGGPTLVGFNAPGQLNILEGAGARLTGGLEVGSGAQGTLILSGFNSPGTGARLEVEGQTVVGKSAAGTIQVSDEAIMASEGDLLIGGPAGASMHLSALSTLVVTGRCVVGELGQGLLVVDLTSDAIIRGPLIVGSSTSQGRLEISGQSTVTCENLQVGGNDAGAVGQILVEDGSLTVDGNAQVGVNAGPAVIHLNNANSTLALDGNMTLGSDNGGGGGGIAMIEATIFGVGSITVNTNGFLSGTGRINLCRGCRVPSGGFISPGLSPGTLSIQGDFSQLPTGVLLIEIAGVEPGQFDVLDINGNVTLGGTVEIRFLDGFLPKAGDSISFLKVSETLTGGFDAIRFPGLAPGFNAELKLDPSGNLSLTAILDAMPGDGTTITPVVIREPALLRITEVSLAGTQLQFVWPTVAGRTYRIESTPDLEQPAWAVHPPDIIATGPASSTNFSILGTRHFYRVLELAGD